MFFYLVFSEIDVGCLNTGNLTNVDCLPLVADSSQIPDVWRNIDAFLHYQTAPVRTDPGAHPASYTVCTGSLPGVNRPGSGVNHPPPSSAEVRERGSPSGSSWPVVG
jgi:hypothetical protein